MNSFRELGKLLIIAGLCLAAVGAWFVLGGRVPFRLGRLPGDISYHGRHGGLYFPVVTCILVSLLLTLILWIVNTFRR